MTITSGFIFLALTFLPNPYLHSQLFDFYFWMSKRHFWSKLAQGELLNPHLSNAKSKNKQTKNKNKNKKTHQRTKTKLPFAAATCVPATCPISAHGTTTQEFLILLPHLQQPTSALASLLSTRIPNMSLHLHLYHYYPSPCHCLSLT